MTEQSTNKPTQPQDQTAAEKAAPARPFEIPYADATLAERYDDIFIEHRPDFLDGFSRAENVFLFRAKNGLALEISVETEAVFRVRYSLDGGFEKPFSYAISPLFEPKSCEITVTDGPETIEIEAGETGVEVQKDGLRVRFFDLLSGRSMCEDASGFVAKQTVQKGVSLVKLVKKAQRKEAFFGLGDKCCAPNLRGKSYSNWCSDAYAFGRESNEMYRAVPFYVSYWQGSAHGFFLDNSARSHFDFDSKNNGSIEISADGGELRYYFIAGKSLTDVVCNYTKLTGLAPLPPLWALGYHQSRWSYYPEQTVYDLVDEFEKHELSIDAVYLDIDYMDNYKCFTVDQSKFPDINRLTTKLLEKGIRTVMMIDPGIKAEKGYEVYDRGINEKHFLKRANGELALAPVWPGFCAFPDFTRKATRAWFGNFYYDFYRKQGIAGFWNDMNEPAVFHVNSKTLPDDVLHDHDSHPTNHAKAHNIYGQQMARATFEGLEKADPDRRPFVLTRAAFSGSQRFGAVWTGDNVADWEHLQIANVQMQRLAVSGFSFSGSDVGGFVGKPDGELMVRWLQLAAFHPFMRAHSSGAHLRGDALDTDGEGGGSEKAVFDREPFSFGEKWTPLAKKALDLRYHLLPALYTAMRRSSVDGTPVLRHLFFEDPTDGKLLDIERDFLFGEHILVSPVVLPKAQRQSIYLPRGNWFYFWTGQLARGGTDFFATLMPEQIPFFVREGAVLPIWPVKKSTAEAANLEELTLYVYYKNGSETSQLYEDAGEGYGHEKGAFAEKTFLVEGTADRFRLTQTVVGDWAAPYKKVVLYLVGLPFFVSKVKIDRADGVLKEIRMRERSIYKLDVEPGFKVVDIQ